MSSMRSRRLFSRSRLRLALTLAIVVLGGAIVAHHTPLDIHGVAGMTETVMCLAVLGAAVVLAIALSVLPRTRMRPPLTIGLAALAVPAARSVPARAGPLYLRLQVLRR